MGDIMTMEVAELELMDTSIILSFITFSYLIAVPLTFNSNREDTMEIFQTDENFTGYADGGWVAINSRFANDDIHAHAGGFVRPCGIREASLDFVNVTEDTIKFDETDDHMSTFEDIEASLLNAMEYIEEIFQINNWDNSVTSYTVEWRYDDYDDYDDWITYCAGKKIKTDERSTLYPLKEWVEINIMFADDDIHAHYVVSATLFGIVEEERGEVFYQGRLVPYRMWSDMKFRIQQKNDINRVDAIEQQVQIQHVLLNQKMLESLKPPQDDRSSDLGHNHMKTKNEEGHNPVDEHEMDPEVIPAGHVTEDIKDKAPPNELEILTTESSRQCEEIVCDDDKEIMEIEEAFQRILHLLDVQMNVCERRTSRCYASF